MNKKIFEMLILKIFQDATSGIYAEIWKYFDPDVGYLNPDQESTDQVKIYF